VTERGENHGSEGGVLGPRRGLWVVVVGIHCRSWCWAFIAIHGGGRLTCLWCSFHGVTWRVLAANRQWAVNGGGAGLVGWVVIDVVRLVTISIRNDDVLVVVVPHQSALHGYHVVQQHGLAHSWDGSWLWGHGVWFSCHRVPVIAFVMCGCSRY